MKSPRHKPLKLEMESRFMTALRMFYSDRDLVFSVSRSKLARDFSEMLIFLSIFPTDKGKTAIRKIRRLLPEVQSYLFKKAELKIFPTFSVELDDSFEHGERILNLIDGVSVPDEEVDQEED